ncbi:MAG: GNAT family N-acetyltransferase [Microbacterium sp.]|nr:GNAT family N-acetyltransferase [Microbacterium sp.]
MNDTAVAAFLAAPLDERQARRLSDLGLRADLVTDEDRAASDGWIEAVSRGFLGTERSEVQRQAAFDGLRARRRLGVYDDSAPVPGTPVATFASWLAELTVPGPALIDTAAISSVTVAPTHRRRGLARAMMEGELRAAASAGVPVATLTVSESTLYGRYGFAPAAEAAHWRIEAKRAGWIGPVSPGRVDFVPRVDARVLIEPLYDRVRLARPGEITMPAGHWDRFLRTRPDSEKGEELRTVVYTTVAGEGTGVALYSVTESHDDFARSTLEVVYLLALDDESYAGLWRFFLEMDLIGWIEATELSVDEPLLWMIADQRAAQRTVRDHHYVRILDVVAALEARRYSGAGRVVIEIADPLGFAAGRVLLDVDGRGVGSVRPADATTDAPSLRLGIAELSAAYLGGVRLATLAAAGRVTGDGVAAASALFAAPQAPRLSFWY